MEILLITSAFTLWGGVVGYIRQVNEDQREAQIYYGR